MRSKFIRVFFAAFVSAIAFETAFSASSASAQTFSQPFGAGSHALVTLSGGRSYSCFVSDSGGYELSLNVVGPSNETITAIYPPVQKDLLRAILSASAAFGDTSLSNNTIAFNTTTGGAGFGDYQITMTSTDPGSANPFLNCLDTTLACGINTFLSDKVFLELVNNGPTAVDISYLMTDSSGATIESTVTTLGGLRSDFDIGTAFGALKYGSVVIRPRIFVPFFGQEVSARVSHYKAGKLMNTEICPLVAFGF